MFFPDSLLMKSSVTNFWWLLRVPDNHFLRSFILMSVRCFLGSALDSNFRNSAAGKPTLQHKLFITGSFAVLLKDHVFHLLTLDCTRGSPGSKQKKLTFLRVLGLLTTSDVEDLYLNDNQVRFRCFVFFI